MHCIKNCLLYVALQTNEGRLIKFHSKIGCFLMLWLVLFSFATCRKIAKKKKRSYGKTQGNCSGDSIP